MKKNSKLYMLFSILISYFSISIASKTLQNDTFSTIKIGQYVLEHGIDFNEHLNFNSGLYYHHARWLYTIVVAFFYNILGYFGIYLLVMILSLILGFVIYNVFLKMKNNYLISFLIAIITMITLGSYISARAQLVSYIFLILEVYSIDKLIETKKNKYIVFIVLYSIAIANFHTSIWPMTLVLFFPYIVEYVISRFKLFKKQNMFYSTTDNYKKLLIAFILVFISGLCTPLLFTRYTFLSYTYMFKTMNGISKDFINELQPTSLLNSKYLLFNIITFITLAFLFKSKIKVSDFFMYGGLLFMALLANRNCAFLYLISPIIFLRLFNNIIYNKRDSYDKIMNFIMNDKVIIVLITFVSVFLSTCIFYYNIKSDYINKKYFPVDATEYILNNIDIENMRIYNGFNYGTYLEFKDIKVFLDSRSEMYCKEFNDTSILEDWYDSSYLKVYYKDVFDKYDFTHIMLYKEEILYNYIKHDKDYKKIYSDKYFVLYEKVQ